MQANVTNDLLYKRTDCDFAIMIKETNDVLERVNRHFKSEHREGFVDVDIYLAKGYGSNNDCSRYCYVS